MRKHIVIIGGGVIGLCTAYYCARRGFLVSLVERRGAERDGCSFGNAGMVVPSHLVPLAAPGAVALALKWMWNPASPFYLKPRLDAELFGWGIRFWRAATAEHVRRAAPLLRDLNLASRACYEELAAGLGRAGRIPALDRGETPDAGLTPDLAVPPGSQSGNACRGPEPRLDFGLVKQGLLMLCKEPHTLDEEAKGAEMAHSLGIPAEVLDAKQTAARDPAVRLDVAGSVYYPLDCYLNPSRLMAALQSEVARLGGQFLWNTEVTDWTVENRHVRAAVIGNGGEIAGDEFVLCGGSWSPSLARQLAASAMDCGKQCRSGSEAQHSRSVPNPAPPKARSGDSRPSPGARLNLPIQAGKGYSLTLPRPRQLPQLCSILAEARVAVTPMGGALRVGGTLELAGLNEDVNPIRVRRIADSFCRYLPEFRREDFDGIPVWRGLRPCSPDGLPFVGRTTKFANLSVAAGHAMMGISLGPVTGKLMAEILSDERPALDIAMLSPDRYG